MLDIHVNRNHAKETVKEPETMKEPEDDTYRCDECNFTSKYKYSLKRHNDKSHKSQTETPPTTPTPTPTPTAIATPTP